MTFTPPIATGSTTTASKAMSLVAIPGIPLFTGGESVGDAIVDACEANGIAIADRDVFVVAQKLVSKAEGRVYPITDFEPSPKALKLSALTGRDAYHCEAFLREGDVHSLGWQTRHGRLIQMRHRLGFVISGAGVDTCNVDNSGAVKLILLPVDPDESSRLIRQRIRERTGCENAVIINDSFGRVDRLGAVGWCIGFNGIKAVERRRQNDLYGGLITAQISLVDELSSAASMLQGQADEGQPVVLVHNAPYTTSDEDRMRDLLTGMDLPELVTGFD
jgi:coenzyme F420-0:L-glutamate ligase / coenzyme F420-1:gamma-L-glutamate ligase